MSRWNTRFGRFSLALLAVAVVLLVVVVALPGSSNQGDWTMVGVMSGKGDAYSSAFDLQGGEQKVEYELQGSPDATVFNLDWGERGGGIEPVAVAAMESGSESLRNGPGRYYLVVHSLGCMWRVTVYELR